MKTLRNYFSVLGSTQSFWQWFHIVQRLLTGFLLLSFSLCRSSWRKERRRLCFSYYSHCNIRLFSFFFLYYGHVFYFLTSHSSKLQRVFKMFTENLQYLFIPQSKIFSSPCVYQKTGPESFHHVQLPDFFFFLVKYFKSIVAEMKHIPLQFLDYLCDETNFNLQWRVKRQNSVFSLRLDGNSFHSQLLLLEIECTNWKRLNH